MFSSVRNFLSRHKRKFILTGAIVGGAYVISHYAQKKLREWQEKETRKFIEMTRKKQHFESTERTCNQTILSLAKVVCDNIMRILDTEEIVRTLKENPENKLQLWERLKVLTFTRICALVYASCILVVILRVQLNLIGGYLYNDSVKSDSSSQLISSELQQKYLSLCHHFISDGVEKLCKQIEAKVQVIVQPISLKKKMTLQDVEQIFWSIQATLCTDDSDPIRQMVTYLLGENDHEYEGTLETIVKATMDLLENDEIVSVSLSSVSRCFSEVVDQVAYAYSPKSQLNAVASVGDEGQSVSNRAARNGIHNGFVDINKIESPLAKLIPIINDLVTKNLCKDHTSIQDLLVQQLTLNDKLKLMGANIYEVFSC